MPAARPPSTRRACAAVALLVGVAVGGLAGPAAPAGAARVARQTDPAPSTEPVVTTEPGGATTGDPGDLDPAATDPTGATEAEAEAAFDAAQQKADDDLRAVWVIVAALAAVALGLFVLLVLYVRATNPVRAARRREQLEAKAYARAVKKGKVVPAPDDDLDDRWDVRTDDGEAEDGDEPGDLEDDDLAAAFDAAFLEAARADAGDPSPGIPAAATLPAGVLTRDPDPADEEGVRVLGAPPAAAAAAGTPARPDAVTPPVTKARPPRPTPALAKGARPTAPAPAGPPPGPVDGDETVRIVPAPERAPMPGPPPGRRDGATVAASVPPPPADRVPPKVLIDTPPPRPKRPRRVDAPAKQLATPDAERVLVRPGQTPVRVPPRPEPSDPPAAEAGEEPAEPDR